MKREYNILVIGDKKCGKTSLINRYITGSFDYNIVIKQSAIKKNISYSNNYIKTYEITTTSLKGENISLKLIDVLDNDILGVNVLDYIKKIHGIMFVYDAKNRKSFNSIRRSYLPLYTELITNQQIKDCFIIVGTKCDITKDKISDIIQMPVLPIEITENEQNQFALANNIRVVGRVSALTGDGVDKLFDGYVQYIHNIYHTDSELSQGYTVRRYPRQLPKKTTDEDTDDCMFIPLPMCLSSESTTCFGNFREPSSNNSNPEENGLMGFTKEAYEWSFMEDEQSDDDNYKHQPCCVPS